MATSLDTGYWNYANRWQYPGDKMDTGIIAEPAEGTYYPSADDEKQELAETMLDEDREAWGESATKVLASPSASPKASGEFRAQSPTVSSPTVSSPTGGNLYRNSSPTNRPESPSFLPPIPSRPSLASQPQSAYTEQFSTTFIQGAPEKNNVPGGLRVPRRRRGRGKAPASFLNHHLDTRYYESQLQREAATPSEKAGRLWGRINAAYCVVPYMTSSQRDFVNWQKQGEGDTLHPVESRFNLKVHRKDFKEEMAKEKRRLKGGGDGN